jgi:putative peptidoglycan lipid II flippase
MPWVIMVLAPGFEVGGVRYAAAVELSRITFVYILFIALVALHGGVLNSLGRFAAAAAAPILLNICMVSTLTFAALFPTAGHAAAWGVFAAGVLQALFVGADAERSGIGIRLRMPRLDEPTRRFLKALGPAVVGAGGVQLALFADTVIATFLPTGSLSALYYADRINQLPIGVVGIAVGVVLLPEMSRRLAVGDEVGAAAAQGKAVDLALALAIPCMVGAIAIPELVMRALFMRGAFTAPDAAAAGATLAAYATGLVPFVLIRSFVAPFYARGDTATPVMAALSAAFVNILLKVALMGPLAQIGLALATAVGAWVNLALLVVAARRYGFRPPDSSPEGAMRLLAAGVAMGLVLFAGRALIGPMLSGVPWLREELLLAILVLLGGAAYAALVMMLRGRGWLRSLAREAGQGPAV